jgi:hypothetical protein
LVERSAGLFSCLRKKQVCQGSATPSPLGATLTGLVGRKPSGIPSAAIMRSQGFSQFQLSFPSESLWVPAPSVSGRAEPRHTCDQEKGVWPPDLSTSGLWIYKAA